VALHDGSEIAAGAGAGYVASYELMGKESVLGSDRERLE
jgi:hypothetical protein